MRIVFMGTPEYAETILKRVLEEGIEVVAVYTQPDKPVGRKRVMTPPPVKTTAERAGIVCYQPTSLRAAAEAERIRSEKPDYIVVAAYGQMLPREILDIAPCINLHASLLPKYRGASPIQQALLNGDAQTGVTAMQMEEGLDSGPVLAWNVIPVTLGDRKSDLFEKLGEMAASLIVDVLNRYDSLRPLPQCDADASYCKKISKRDGLVTFDLPVDEIYNRFRAYEGWPGIYLPGGLKLLEIALEPTETAGLAAGKIISVESDGVVVACADRAVKIVRVQPPSKKAMDAVSYIRGKRLGVDDLFV